MIKISFRVLLIILICHCNAFGQVNNALLKNVQAKLESERETAVEEFDAKNEEFERLSIKNIELLKSGEVCNSRFNPKLHQWVYNNLSNEACLIISENELNQYSGMYYLVKGICSESAV